MSKLSILNMVRLHGRNVLTQNADADMPTLRGNGQAITLYTLNVVNAEPSLWMDNEGEMEVLGVFLAKRV
jgi:hypothetical protein